MPVKNADINFSIGTTFFRPELKKKQQEPKNYFKILKSPLLRVLADMELDR